MTEYKARNVKSFILEKPRGYSWKAGQFVKISIDHPKWSSKRRPFSFANLPDDEVIEFIIKAYPERNGVTKQLHTLKPGDKLILSEPTRIDFYKGKGLFIAGGTGITPFISIFRDLFKRNELKGNKLIFSNNTYDDIILEKELKYMFNDDALFVLTKEKKEGYYTQPINETLLEKYKDQEHFYLCGPEGFTDYLKNILLNLDVDRDKINQRIIIF